MAEIIISNLQVKVEVSEKLYEVIKNVINTTLLVEVIPKSVEISIVLVDNEYIQKLNMKYRNKDVPTDVLSFALRESYEDEPEVFQIWDEEPMGDIVVSLEKAKEQAQEYGHSFEREVGYLVVHGMLHLLGFDHMDDEETKIMRKKEEAILAKADLKRGNH